ncbi:winged helix-turn-helix domain-containing tetratricopeptide repeat protein [Ideonella sp.]|uniref:winged helix-turn-helix domain-containing tetratricopeptide repeat protein n=1 Tax=Ideonella sp. TaxID=1929293 RepID=UPI002B45E109|nr:winged helix-turn-helix domain-containing protein [Ideonella sp.]HJV71543.1 winged helix-turn-helix domain-containing protein [Ideonella sp.]
MAQRFAFGPFILDVARGTLTSDGAAVAIGQRGMRILKALLDAQGGVVGKNELMQLAWPGLVVEDSNLSVQIAALRRQLGPAAGGVDWIVTVPRAGYRLVGAIAVEDATLAPVQPSPADRGGRPSVAVLPFATLSDDPSQDYFADGVTEDIIAALTRFRWFSVVGRNASHVYKLRPVDAITAARELGVRYALEGAVRRAGPRLRVSARLSDAAGGHCLWADHVDIDMADVFTVQDTIARQVVGAIEPELLQREGGLAAHRRAGAVTAWDLVAQGAWHFHHVTEPTHWRARELFRQAAQIDSESTEAHLWLGRVNAGLVAYGWSTDTGSDLREGRQAAVRAVELDDKSPYAHYALAIVSVYGESFDTAIRAAEQAIELSPGFALGHLVHGMARLFSGDAPAAIESLQRGLELNRHDPQNFIWLNVLALAQLFDGRPEAGLRTAVAALKVRPAWRPSAQVAAACCAALERIDEARQWRGQLSVLPAPRGDALQPLWHSQPRWAEAMQRLLQAPPAPAGRDDAG